MWKSAAHIYYWCQPTHEWRKIANLLSYPGFSVESDISLLINNCLIAQMHPLKNWGSSRFEFKHVFLPPPRHPPQKYFLRNLCCWKAWSNTVRKTLFVNSFWIFSVVRSLIWHIIQFTCPFLLLFWQISKTHRSYNCAHEV